MTVTDVRREIILLLWSTARERALAKVKDKVLIWGCEVSMCLQKNEAVWKGCTQ